MELTKQEAAMVHIALMDLRSKIDELKHNCEKEKVPHYQNQIWQIESVLFKLERQRGFIVVSRKQNVWLNAFTSEEAANECKDKYNNEFWDYQVIECKTSNEWDIFARAMDEKGCTELARMGVDKSLEAYEKETKNG